MSNVDEKNTSSCQTCYFISLAEFGKGFGNNSETMTHNKFMKAKNIPFEIAGVDYEKE